MTMGEKARENGQQITKKHKTAIENNKINILSEKTVQKCERNGQRVAE